MKKKFFALALAATLTVCSTAPIFAATKATPTKGNVDSPEKLITITNTPTPRPTITRRATITPTRTSPKTGETDYVLYGILGATAFGSVVVVSKRKKNKEV